MQSQKFPYLTLSADQLMKTAPKADALLKEIRTYLSIIRDNNGYHYPVPLWLDHPSYGYLREPCFVLTWKKGTVPQFKPEQLYDKFLTPIPEDDLLEMKRRAAILTQMFLSHGKTLMTGPETKGFKFAINFMKTGQEYGTALRQKFLGNLASIPPNQRPSTPDSAVPQAA